MPRICATTPRGTDGRPVKVRCLVTAKAFIERLVALATGEGSFTRYMTVNGYSSYGVVKDQPCQGLLKAALADVHELRTRASNGDPEAINALLVINEYLGEMSLVKASA